ncbi:MAG: glycoside hydrolase [Phycisphaerae bacterium]|nr:glycoside hydrolase [Phycisphaerae bacterium]
MRKRFPRQTLLLVAVCISSQSLFANNEHMTYRRFDAVDRDGRVTEIAPAPSPTVPRWARDVSQKRFDWTTQTRNDPFFAKPIPFVLPPEDEKEPFYKHNHQPSITWLLNGDLLAIWYSTRSETGPILTVLASRLRPGKGTWEPSSEFFKAPDRNMHGSSIFHDGRGKTYHFNGMAPRGATGWKKLALLMRTSNDNGVMWTPPRAIDDRLIARHQVISGTFMTKGGALIQNCDAVPGVNGGTALHISFDGGRTWTDPGEGKPGPIFTEGGKGQGTIAGIHAKVVELGDGRLLAFGRGDTINGRMPMSISADLGKTWTYKASSFPPIGGGQRLVLKRLLEGPLLFVSFTSGKRAKPESSGMTFTDRKGKTFTGHGMYAAVSFDDGKTWPVRKLLTPGEGEFNGGAWTQQFTATPTRAEHAGYLASTQTPDGVIHLISSRLHYRFNLPWLLVGVPSSVSKSSRRAQP